jgi:hypothetical protein
MATSRCGRTHRLVVLLLGVQRAGLHVDVGLQQRRRVDGVRRRARVGERGLGLRRVLQGVVHAAFGQKDLHLSVVLVSTRADGAY